jgi:hypothetical protein
VELVDEAKFLTVACLSYLLLALVARQLALLGMERLPRVLRKADMVQSGILRRLRNPYIRSVSPNPIEFRESTREAVTTPFGLLGLLVVRLPLLAVALVTATQIPHLTFSSSSVVIDETWILGVMFAAIVSFVLAIGKTMNIFLADCEGKTWEPLCQSGLSARELIDGLCWVGVRWRLLEGLGILAVLGALGLPWSGWYLLIICLPILGVTVGLEGASTGSSVAAHQSCGEITMALAATWVVTMVLFGWNAYLTAGLILGMAYLLRYKVLRKLTTQSTP